jgi:glycosyltransferase involved in cell wall biosynthesis
MARSMARSPRISIVTPALNQVTYVAETIESVLAQHYPHVEHIVVDGGSTDGTPDMVGRYPHVKLIVERDRGHAGAVNTGFRLATGDVWGVLSSGDTLLPDALPRVGREIDPGRARHIVLGRCRFVDEQGRFIGIEHPCHFEGHRRVLEVWKGHSIPPPAVFWTPEVWRICGPMDETLGPAWIDYDLFCRFSRRYRFHLVDQVLATYRLHPESRMERWSSEDRLEDAIGLSRRYWGSPLSPMRWELALSLARFRLDRVGRARRYLRQMTESRRRGQVLGVVRHAVLGALLAPEVAFYVVVYPRIRDRAIGVWKKARAHLGRWGGVPPETVAYLDRTEAWADGWVGPRIAVTRETEHAARTVALRGRADLQYMSRRLVLTIRVDHRVVGRHRVRRVGDFVARIRLADPLAPGAHTVEVEASAWFVPHRFGRNGDFRPLAWRMDQIELEAELASS